MKQPQQEAHQETQIEIQPPTNMLSYAKKNALNGGEATLTMKRQTQNTNESK